MNIQEFIQSKGKEIDILQEEDCLQILGGIIIEDDPLGI